jgi:hypothetical protein
MALIVLASSVILSPARSYAELSQHPARRVLGPSRMADSGQMHDPQNMFAARGGRLRQGRVRRLVGYCARNEQEQLLGEFWHEIQFNDASNCAVSRAHRLHRYCGSCERRLSRWRCVRRECRDHQLWQRRVVSAGKWRSTQRRGSQGLPGKQRRDTLNWCGLLSPECMSEICTPGRRIGSSSNALVPHERSAGALSIGRWRIRQ